MEQEIPKAGKPRRAWRNAPRIATILLAALLVATLVRISIAEPFIVSGDSMLPAYHSGDYLVIDRLSTRFEPLKKDDVVVFEYPLDPSYYLVKRIDALPGETVVEDTGAIATSTSAVPTSPDATTSRTLTLASDEYFVLGDNRAVSSDSRSWGPLQRKFIVGRVLLRIWPWNGN